MVAIYKETDRIKEMNCNKQAYGHTAKRSSGPITLF